MHFQPLKRGQPLYKGQNGILYLLFQEGREGRAKFGSKRRKLNPDSSSTNKQKAKKKAFTMIRHKRSVRGKVKKSFREKQVSTEMAYLSVASILNFAM